MAMEQGRSHQTWNEQGGRVTQANGRGIAKVLSLKPASFKHLFHADSKYILNFRFLQLQIMKKLQFGTLRHGISKTKLRQLSKCLWLNKPGCGLTVPQMKGHSTEPKSGWKDLLAQIQSHANAVITLPGLT